MRMLLTVCLDTPTTNAAIQNGALPKVWEEMFAKLNPEATYFTATGGERTAYIVFDLQDPSQMPPVAEPFFDLNAKVTFRPVMNADELRAGLEQLRTAGG
jgi:hypothetical protein